MMGCRCFGMAGMASLSKSTADYIDWSTSASHSQAVSNGEKQMTERVRFRVEDRVAHIDLDDGKVNVMSAAMLADIGSALDRAEDSADVVVLRSARQGIFSAGFDLKVFAAGDAA